MPDARVQPVLHMYITLPHQFCFVCKRRSFTHTRAAFNPVEDAVRSVVLLRFMDLDVSPQLILPAELLPAPKTPIVTLGPVSFHMLRQVRRFAEPLVAMWALQRLLSGMRTSMHGWIS
jgi:hypothetical protein